MLVFGTSDIGSNPIRTTIYDIMSWIETLKSWLGIASEINITTPRACLSAFTRAIEQCDMNSDGMINSKELLKLYKKMTINSVIGYEMTTDELKMWLDDFCKRK